jgi:hypothetical protein
MSKVDSKTVFKRLKTRQEAEERGNFTFRLKKELMRKFKSKCERPKHSMASVLEELISHFNDY